MEEYDIEWNTCHMIFALDCKPRPQLRKFNSTETLNHARTENAPRDRDPYPKHASLSSMGIPSSRPNLSEHLIKSIMP